MTANELGWGESVNEGDNSQLMWQKDSVDMPCFQRDDSSDTREAISDRLI